MTRACGRSALHNVDGKIPEIVHDSEGASAAGGSELQRVGVDRWLDVLTA